MYNQEKEAVKIHDLLRPEGITLDSKPGKRQRVTATALSFTANNISNKEKEAVEKHYRHHPEGE